VCITMMACTSQTSKSSHDFVSHTFHANQTAPTELLALPKAIVVKMAQGHSFTIRSPVKLNLITVGHQPR
jgi:hypothetical protein